MSEQNIYLLSMAFFWSIVIYLFSVIFLSLKFASNKLRIEKKKRNILLSAVMCGLGFWTLLISAISFSGFFSNFESLPPRIFMVIAIPIGLMIILLNNSFFSKILEVIPEKWLIYFQSFRIVMELMLYFLFLAKVFPFQMTFVGFNHDILIGITAVFGGYFFFMKNRRQKFAGILWNISGIALLINIVAITTLSTPSPYRVFLNDPSSEMIATFPFILIPGFIVPVAVAGHVFSIKQLLRR